MAGLDYDAFWTRTPVELHLILTAHYKRAQTEHEKRRVVAHETARLVAYAFHDPKNIPDYKPQKPARKAEQGSAADDARVRAHLIAMALRSRRK